MQLLPTIRAILILNEDGTRLYGKYYGADCDVPEEKKQSFEKLIFTKTARVNGRVENEILIMDGKVIIFRLINDIGIFVIGSVDDNELILSTVLTGIFDALTYLLKGTIDKHGLLEFMDFAIVCVDEACDNGMILETDGQTIHNRVLMKGVDGNTVGGTSSSDVPVLGQQMKMLKDQLKGFLS